MTATEPVDVVIVGSGFGAAVTALRLAEHGIAAVMLERGQRWPVGPDRDTFSTLRAPDGRSAWLSDVAVLGDATPVDRFAGVLERIAGNGIDVFAGAGVGGGSLVFGGALVQPPRPVFDRIFRGRIDYDEMDAVYYPRVRRTMGASPCPPGVLNRPAYAASRAWLALGQQAGLPTRLVDLAIDWQIVEEELAGTRMPSVISGEAWYGNNGGAKRSLDQSYLRLAEASGRVDILTHHVVHEVRYGPDRRFLIAANQIDDSGSVIAHRRFAARKVFLGAGSIGTSRLLVRARGRGWLARLGWPIGTQWGNNGDVCGAVSELGPSVRPDAGGPVTAVIEDLDNPLGPTVVECFADWTRAGECGTVAGAGRSPVGGTGTFIYDPASDEVTLDWPVQDATVLRGRRAVGATFRRLSDAAEDRCAEPDEARSAMYGVTSTETGRRSPATASTGGPLGGVPLGLATDDVGRVRPYSGLYVVDGALLPGHAACAGPALTIAAVVERNIERIVEQDW
jgi:cholesterol oxidase